MKFIDYLEAVKADVVYSELFNINAGDIKMKKIVIPNEEQKFLQKLLKEIKLKEIKVTDIFLKPDEIFSLLSKSFSRDKFDLVSEKIKRIKNENAYASFSNELYKEGEFFLFFVKDKLYTLRLLYLFGAFDITFNEQGEDIKLNSMMSSKEGSSELFNKIASIIKTENTDWAEKVFSFKGERSNLDETNFKLIKKASSAVFNLLLVYLQNKKITEIKISNVRELLKKINKNIKNKLKELIIKEIEKLKKIPEINKKSSISFINFIFSDLSLNDLKQNSNSFAPAKELSTSFIDDIPDISEYLAEMCLADYGVRNRIYRIIIKQMFGDNVEIRNDEYRVYFSLSKKAIALI